MVFRHREPPFPLQISFQIVTQQPVRPKINIDALSVRGGRRTGGAADSVDLFDLVHGDLAPPQDFARTAINAERGEFLARLIELSQEDTIRPNDGRRQSGPNRRLPLDVLVGAKVNGRFACAESRRVRSPKLGPPKVSAV